MYSFYCLFFLAAYGLSAVSAENRCVLPAYPRNGYYTVPNMPDATPGQTYDTVVLLMTCNPGYTLSSSNIIACWKNMWSQPIPQCTAVCKLTPHESVNYLCKVTGEHELTGLRSCNEYEPSGTIVVPECKSPNYYYNGILLNMHCVDGFWDYIAVCQPECGTPIAKSQQLIINGVNAKRGELPWHAGIYSKLFTPYKQICGGSLISRTLVISAAHCFWTDGVGLEAVERYAVGLGKIYRPWDNPNDVDAHKSDVRDIRVPVRFLGVEANYQEDIALVIMSTPVEFTSFIRPVCINFDLDFDNRQLHTENFGKVVGWGLTEENASNGSPLLKTAEIPYVDIGKCIADLPFSFRSHITSDKICGGYLNGNISLCKGDSGGGFVFPDVDHGIQRYYLRGVVSSAPRSDNKCNTETYTIFTHISKHSLFIKEKGLWLEGRQSSPYSCEANPGAVYCVPSISDQHGGSESRAPPVYEPSTTTPDYDKQLMGVIRNGVRFAIEKLRSG